MDCDDFIVYEVCFQGHFGSGSCEFSIETRAVWFAEILKAQGFDCIIFRIATSAYDMME